MGLVSFFLQPWFPPSCQYLPWREPPVTLWKRYTDAKNSIRRESIFCCGHCLLWDIFWLSLYIRIRSGWPDSGLVQCCWSPAFTSNIKISSFIPPFFICIWSSWMSARYRLCRCSLSSERSRRSKQGSFGFAWRRSAAFSSSWRSDSSLDISIATNFRKVDGISTPSFFLPF